MVQLNDKNEKENDEAGGYAVLEFSKKSSKRKRRLKSLALLLFNILVIAVIVIIEATGNRERVDISTVLSTWGKNWYFIIVALGLVVVYYLCLTIRISLLIRSTTGRPRRKLSFSTAVLGKYYDNITPFGSGGQPFQMFNLGRKLDVGLATSIPIADYIIHQLVFTVIAIVVFIVNSKVMADNDFMRIAAYVGIVVFASIPVFVIIFSIFPRGITLTAKFVCRVGHKLHIVKDLEKAEIKAISAVEKYTTSLKFVSKKWGYLVLSAFISAICWISYHSIPYFVLRVCGVDNGYFDTVCLSIFISAAITVIPTPGSAGAAEGAFYAIFQSLTGGFLFWGTMLWRFCIYYLSLIFGFSITIYQYIKASRKEKRANLAMQVPPSTIAQAEAGECITENDSEPPGD